MLFSTLFAGILLFQDLTHRFEAPAELTGFLRHQFQAHMNVESYDRSEAEWKDACDPKKVLPVSLKQELWDSKVVFELRAGVLDSKIDRLGVSVESKTYKAHKKEFDDFRAKLERSVVNKKLSEVCRELKMISEEVQAGIRVDNQELSLFVRFHNQPMAEGKLECWMMVEIAPRPKDWPVYPVAVLHRLMLRGIRTMTLLEPNPRQALRALAIKNYFEVPLEPNRPSILDKYEPPIPALVDDGLECAQREKLFDFSVIEEKDAPLQHQIELIVWDKGLPYGGGLLRTLHRRIPPGKVLSYEEIHAICGELATTLRSSNKFDDYHFLFLIQPEIRGKNVYSRLRLSAVNKSK